MEKITEQQVIKIINYASKAPSGHNTQPWKFTAHGNSIIIDPDFGRSLPVVDPDNHALYISLGCALENLIIAATHFGIKANYEFVQKNNEYSIHITLKPDENKEESPLFAYIEKRQVTRKNYNKENVDNEILLKCIEHIEEPDFRVEFFKNKEEIEKIKPFILEGNRAQFKNKKFVNELVSWIRFSENKAMKTGDGVWGGTMGMPNIPKITGNFIMKHLVTAKSEKKRIEKNLENSAGLVLFMVKEHHPVSWIKLGRVFQQFGLRLTSFNVRHAHLNMPCEEEEVRVKMQEALSLKPYIPILLIRFGYAEPMPYSFRRKLNDVLININGQ